MVVAKKSLGQHFLRSTRALEKIIEAGEVGEGDAVLEIGPGEGVLTEKLLACSLQLIAVEKDDVLYEFLKTKFQKEIIQKKLTLIHEDILDFDLSKLAAKSYKLIANIPYNITGAILEKFLSAEHQPERLVLLVQDEVAKRIVGRHPLGGEGTKESILSISVKAYGTPRYVDKVLAGSFVPTPAVNSAIIAITEVSKEFFKGFSEEFFFQVVRTGFKSKRKKLSSNLSAVFDKEKVAEAFEKLGLDPNTRAEDVSVDIWGHIAALLVI